MQPDGSAAQQKDTWMGWNAERDYLNGARRWLWLVLLATLVGGVAAYLTSRAVTPTYLATATLLVNATETPNALTYSDVLLSQQLTITYSQMVTEPVVLEQVIADAKLPLTLYEFQKKGIVEASTVRDTQLISISARATSPAEAKTIANLVAQTFISQQRKRLASGEASNAISIVQPALAPIEPVFPKVTLNTALGAAAGGFLAIAVVALILYLDDTVKSQQSIENVLQLPVLGLVWRDRAEAKPLVDGKGASRPGRSAEAFRIIRTNLEFVTSIHQEKVLLVTSAQKGDGKTTIASNLAVTLAEAGKRVILVDADLRLPLVHRYFDADNGRGLTNLLVNRQADIAGELRCTPLSTLRILVSGPLPPNPADLLQSERMSDILARLGAEADVVIIDSPPVLAVADAMSLASKADAVILVVANGSTRVGSMRQAVLSLRRAMKPILGVVLNKVPREARAYYQYDRYSAYYTASSVQESSDSPAPGAPDAVVAGLSAQEGRE